MRCLYWHPDTPFVNGPWPLTKVDPNPGTRIRRDEFLLFCDSNGYQPLASFRSSLLGFFRWSKTWCSIWMNWMIIFELLAGFCSHWVRNLFFFKRLDELLIIVTLLRELECNLWLMMSRRSLPGGSFAKRCWQSSYEALKGRGRSYWATKMGNALRPWLQRQKV